LAVPYLNYDSNFKQLTVPPLFNHVGPDGSSIRVLLDRWACSTAQYRQGNAIQKKPETIQEQWLHHYTSLGSKYPLRAILACGTHGDITPKSGDQVRGFADCIIRYNAQANSPAKLVNANHSQFWELVDQVKNDKPFLTNVAGSFGHTWDLWPFSLAKYAADARKANAGSWPRKRY